MNRRDFIKRSREKFARYNELTEEIEKLYNERKDLLRTGEQDRYGARGLLRQYIEEKFPGEETTIEFVGDDIIIRRTVVTEIKV